MSTFEPGDGVKRGATPTVLSLLRGLVVLRWALLVWMVGVVVLLRHKLRHPWVAAALVVVTCALTVVRSLQLRGDPDRLLSRRLALGEVALAWALFVGDGWVFNVGHVYRPEQALTASFHVVAAMAVGAAFGPLGGGLAGFSMGIARYFGALANEYPFHDWRSEISSLVATCVFSMLFGAVTGWIIVLLRRAENEVALARARDEVARTLHDGVLQTLSLVDRRTRSSDPELAALARGTDRDLRAYLFGVVATGPQDLRPALQAAITAVAQRYDMNVEFSVLEGDQEPPPDVVRALAGAVGEALTNAAKHAGAAKVVVFADADHDDGVVVTVHDDGCGFDPAHVRPGARGVLGSIEGRMRDAGGRAEIASRPGHGTEVRLYGPSRRSR